MYSFTLAKWYMSSCREFNDMFSASVVLDSSEGKLLLIFVDTGFNILVDLSGFNRKADDILADLRASSSFIEVVWCGGVKVDLRRFTGFKVNLEEFNDSAGGLENL